MDADFTKAFCHTATESSCPSWFDGARSEMITNSIHRFLDQFGQFPTIAEMPRNGSTTVVLASGTLVEVTAERIIYSAATAHLFERAMVQGMVAGNAALKLVQIDAWQTYNIEAEELLAISGKPPSACPIFDKGGSFEKFGKERL